jgi:hypothetical protein
MNDFVGNYKAEISIEVKQLTKENMMEFINWCLKDLGAWEVVCLGAREPKGDGSCDRIHLRYSYSDKEEAKHSLEIGQYLIAYRLANIIIKMDVLEEFQETSQYQTGNSKDIQKISEKENWTKEININ